MLPRTFNDHSRPGRLPGWIRFRRKPPLPPGHVAPQPRVWSLLLPPRYPAGRR